MTRDPTAEAARLRAIHSPPHQHTWTPIDGTIFAASYAQPNVLVCLEDGKTHSHSWYRFDLDQRPLDNPICMGCGQRQR